MPKFNRSSIDDLKKYIYCSNVHDAKIETMSYDIEKKIFMIRAVNSIYGEEINFFFNEVKNILFVSGNEMGNRETIISLTVEEDSSYRSLFTNMCSDCLSKSIYLLFQMFSGDELHILSKNVLIDKCDMKSLKLL